MAAQYFGKKGIEVFAAEPELANDTYNSFKSGEYKPNKSAPTIAEGLRVNIYPMNLEILKKYAKDVLLVSEQEIIDAMLLVYQRLKIVIETSCAVAVAAVLKNKEVFQGKKVGAILSGGNVDLTSLPFKN